MTQALAYARFNMNSTSAFVKGHDGREAQRAFNGNEDCNNAKTDQQNCRPYERGWIDRRNAVHEFGYTLTKDKGPRHAEDRPDYSNEDSLLDEEPRDASLLGAQCN